MLQERIELVEQQNYEAATKLREAGLKPCVAIINANIEDEPSQRYIRNKIKKLEENGIATELIQIGKGGTLGDIVESIHRCNYDSTITSIILQLPLADKFKKWEKKLIEMIESEKDIDRLRSEWYYCDSFTDLPLTAEGMYRTLLGVEGIGNKKILFYGNGVTTNRRLYLFLFNAGFGDCRIINSKTPTKSKNELIEWADVIVAATGIPESLACEGKIVISPTIAKTEDGFRSDLIHKLRDKNEVHNVIGGIGKLTVSTLVRRSYTDCTEGL